MGRSGLWVCAKDSEKTRFAGRQHGKELDLRCGPEELAMLNSGQDVAEARPRKNWVPRVPTT